MTQTQIDRDSACDLKVFHYNLAERKAGKDTGYRVGYPVVQEAKKALARVAHMDANNTSNFS